MSLEDERERRRKADSPADGEAYTRPSRKRKRPSDSGQIGNALRSIYDKTVDEAIPSEMLDLLGKLG